MRKTLLAATAAVALAMSSGFALADDSDNNADVENSNQADTVFDLGIDVTNVPQDHADVQKFLASLPSDTRDILMTTCDHYMQSPVTATDHDTITFCSIATNSG